MKYGNWISRELSHAANTELFQMLLINPLVALLRAIGLLRTVLIPSTSLCTLISIVMHHAIKYM